MLPAFPFSNGDGLCSVLRDPGLCAAIVDETGHRRAIKRADKRLSHQRVARVEDDNYIGAACVRLLSSGRGRAELDRFLFVRNWLGMVLTNHVQENYEETLAEADSALLDLHAAPEKRFQELANFLGRNPTEEQNRLPIALLGCALAVGNPANAARIAKLLIDHDESFSPMLADGFLDSAESAGPAVVGQPLAAPSAQNRIPTEPGILGTRDGEGAHPCAVGKTVALQATEQEQPPGQESPWERSIPIEQWRRMAAQLHSRAESELAALRRLDELAQTVEAPATEAANLPWWTERLNVESLVRLRLHATGEDERSRLAAEGQQLARLLKAHARLDALRTRLHHPATPWLPTAGTTVSDLALRLEERADLFAARLEEIGAVIDRSMTLLDEIAGADELSAARVVSELSSQPISELTRVLFDPSLETEETRHRRELLAKPDVASMMLALLWTRDEAAAIETADVVPAFGSDADAAVRGLAWFEWLSFGQLQVLADAYPRLAPSIAVAIFAVALQRDRPELLAYLDTLLNRPLFDAPVRDFFEALTQVRHRGSLSTLVGELQSASSARERTSAGQQVAERHRIKVLETVNQTPGMAKMFHRLRVLAQVQFLQPLRPAIERDDPAAAWKAWRACGEIDEMVEACISNLDSRDKPEQRHYQQTREYLRNFEENLDHWVRVHAASRADAIPELVQAMTSLRTGASHSLTAKTLLEIMKLEIIPIPDRFGERIASAGMVRLSSDLHEGFIRPTLLATWAQAMKGMVTLASLFSDRLREALVPGGITIAHAVEHFLDRGRFDAARRAAVMNPELDSVVQSAVARHRKLVEEQYSELMSQAARLRDVDPDISEYLAEAETSLADANFAEARAALELLRECLDQFRRRYDPERAELLQFLAEAGHTVPAKLSIDQLRRDVDRLRGDSMERRDHVVALNEAASHPKAATPVQEIWADAARRIDRPALWPSAEAAGLLAEAVEVVGTKLRGKWSSRVDEDDPSTIIVRRAAEWLRDEVENSLKASDSVALNCVIELAQRLEEGCGDAALLQFLGATAPAPAAPRLAAAEPRETVRHEPTKKRANPATPTPVAAPAPSILKEMINAETPLQPADMARLHKALRSGYWQQAQGLIACLFRSADPANAEIRDDLVAAYACTRLLTLPENGDVPAWLLEACISVAGARRSARYWIGERMAQEIVPRAILLAVSKVAPDQAEASGGEKLGRALETMAELPPQAPEYLWLADLFRRAEGTAPAIARQVWDWFTGMVRNDRYRSALLRLLFRSRQHDALQALAADAPDRVQALIRTAVKAFLNAESQPEARAAALQLSAALREQSAGIPNTKPWIRLFHSIEAARDSDEGTSVTVEPDSTYIFAEPSGQYTVEVRMKPSLFAPPESLALKLGSAAPVPLCEEALFTERTVRVPLANDIEFSAAGECVVPWSLRGQTTLGQRIEGSGTWRLHRSKAGKPIEAELLDVYWPGAKCEPVRRHEGFFGRVRELKLIESYLNSNPRPRSVMVFGERRIGKTSVLKTLLATMQPGRGRACGAFCDVSGLRPAKPDESLSAIFFHRLLAAMDTADDNGALLSSLESHNGHPVSPQQLGRDLDPKLSLFTALSMLAKRLEEASGGAISRLALFIDEFDRFAAPLLLQDRAQVDSFMWELREVVQRSERIALVLAGSGIQRLLKDHYTDALYGSIVEVNLPRFQWPADRDAILDTFAPPSVREQLCGPGDFSRVAAYAAQLCGGHPMFLALLGSTAAALANGRHVTPGLLDQVVDRLVSEDGPLQTLNVGRKTFYQSVLQPLEVLPRGEYALACGLLVSLAEHTLADSRFASISVGRLLEVSGLLEYASTRELLQAMDRLAKAEAIVNDKARVRIAVPLTAAAIRQDALLLRDDIIQTLKESTTP